MEHVYPLLGLETVSTISESARVGRATVVRFIQRLASPIPDPTVRKPAWTAIGPGRGAACHLLSG